MKPIEFETVTVEEAIRSLEGPALTPSQRSPADMRVARPEEPLLHITRVWLASLPEHVCPMELAREFPRIANRLRYLWKQVARCEEYMDCLLVDRRGTRKGFPEKITQELEALREYHASLYPNGQSVWRHVEAG